MFKNTERNKKLREQILTYHISSVMTDDERAQLLGLPEGCRIRENAKIISPENFKCGHHVWIGEGAILDASGGLEIGNYTQIGVYVLVWTHTSVKQALRSGTCVHSNSIVRKPTKIGNNCFIAGHSVIYPGVTIGDRVIVLPMSVVNEDVPDDSSIVGGSPIEKLKDIERKVKELERKIEELVSVEKHNKKEKEG